MIPSATPVPTNQLSQDSDPTPSSFPRSLPEKETEWDDNLEKVAGAMGDMGQVQLQLCLESFRYYDLRDKWLSLPVAIIGSLIATGIAVVQQQSNSNPRDSQIVMYVFSVMGILVTIMKIVNSIFSITELKNKFEMASQQWERFATNVNLELFKRREHRMFPSVFFARYQNDLLQLQKTTPTPPLSVVHSFISMYQGKKGSEQRTTFHRLFKPFTFPTLHPTWSTSHAFLSQPGSADSASPVSFTPNSTILESKNSRFRLFSQPLFRHRSPIVREEEEEVMEDEEEKNPV